MDPTKQFFADSPRDVSEDAFFTTDRSSTAVSRAVTVCDLTSGERRDCKNSATVSIDGWKNRFPISQITSLNPLPQQRMTATSDQHGEIDHSLAGWGQEVTYVSLASPAAASVLSPGSGKRLRVSILFTTLGGASSYRHGLCTWVGGSSEPVVLILVPGVDPTDRVDLKNPASGEVKQFTSNNRWGVGITDSVIQQSIAKCLGVSANQSIPYDVVILGCYSTGNLGLAGCTSRNLFSCPKLERVILYDCLYQYLKQPLQTLQGTSGSVQVIAYIVTGGGNSFAGDPSLQTLVLGGNSSWSYINLLFESSYYAAASAHLIAEAVPPGNAIITSLPPPFESAFNDIKGVLPARGSVISDGAVFKRVKGSIPSGAFLRTDLLAANMKQFQLFSNTYAYQLSAKCVCFPQLLGWKTPLGETWHDMLLVEFGWEFLI